MSFAERGSAFESLLQFRVEPLRQPLGLQNQAGAAAGRRHDRAQPLLFGARPLQDQHPERAAHERQRDEDQTDSYPQFHRHD